MVSMAFWVVRYGWLIHKVETDNYVFTTDEMHDFKNFAKARYDYGIQAWLENDLAQAKNFFRDALFENVLYMDAWLKLAQVESAKGDSRQATRILTFTDKLTKNVVKWKWPQILLAHELNVHDIFLQNINFVIPYYRIRKDALQLLDMECRRNTADVINVLNFDNLPFYLEWLMKWHRTSDTLLVWNAMAESDKIDNQLADRYMNFLVSQKDIGNAAKIRQKFTDIEGITNPGFETPLSRKGFGWRYGQGKNREWDVKRLQQNPLNGNYALRISFFGEKNIQFYHFSQIVPVQPLKSYQISYWWRSENITTDKRPYLEIRSFEGKSVLTKSPMIQSSAKWQAQRLSFLTPEHCQAIVIRVRRDRSHRFDSKIEGQMWLDNFHLEKK